MDGDLGGAGRGGAWVVLAICALIGCNASPEGDAAAPNASAQAATVVEEVRVATDRSGAQRGVVTLPSGERMRRMSLGSGFSHVLVAKPGPDGTPSISCVDSAPAAESFLADNKQGAGQ
jgi:hypothetical protein